MSRKTGAPHAFRSALRAPLHARETRSTLVAGRAAVSGRAFGRCFARLDQVSRACRLGAPELRPPLRHRRPGGRLPLGDGLRPAGGCLAAPPAFRRSAWGGRTSRGQGSSALTPRHALRPCRGSPASPGCHPATTRLPACVCRGTDCCQTVRNVAATLCRDNRLRRMSCAFRLLSPPPIPGDAHPAQPTCKGLRHSVRPFSRSLTGCGLGCALAVRPFALGA